MLEAEWRQVLRGSVSAGTKEVQEAFGLLGFTMLRPVRGWRTF